MNEMDTKALEEMVRKVLGEIMGSGEGSGADDELRHRDASGVMSFRVPKIKPDPFDTGNPRNKVFLKDLASVEESGRLGFGVMEMDKSAFDWTLRYDEVNYVVEGRLEILVDGRTVAADKGEMIFIPKGSSITFSAPGFARFVYVVYPANWASL